MNASLLKDFFFSCRDAKKILELMPQLPDGMTPRHIQIIDTIFQLECKNELVKISDISAELNVTRPSITRLVTELTRLGAVKKAASGADGRVIYVSLTDSGRSYYDFYVRRYHAWVMQQAGDITDAELETAVSVMRRFYAALKNAEPPKP